VCIDSLHYNISYRDFKASCANDPWIKDSLSAHWHDRLELFWSIMSMTQG